MLKTNYYSVALINYTFFSTLKYYRFFFVTLMVSSGLTDLVFISTAAYHKNYTENISLTNNLSTYQVTLL